MNRYAIFGAELLVKQYNGAHNGTAVENSLTKWAMSRENPSLGLRPDKTQTSLLNWRD